jgi:hypothetical protein
VASDVPWVVVVELVDDVAVVVVDDVEVVVVVAFWVVVVELELAVLAQPATSVAMMSVTVKVLTTADFEKPIGLLAIVSCPTGHNPC